MIEKENFSAFSGFRFLFVIGVFFHHSSSLPFWGKYGYIGVTFFFILSGFVMMHSYYDRIANNQVSMGAFLKKRVMRLFPIHLLCLSYFAIPLLIQDARYWRWILVDGLMLQSWFSHSHVLYSCNHPTWFVSCLMFCYLCFVPMCLIIRKNIKLFVVLWLSAVVSYLAVILLSNNSCYYSYFFPPFRLLGFSLGMLIYLAMRRRNITIQNKKKANIIELSSIAIVVLFYVVSSCCSNVIRRDILFWVPFSLLIVCFATTNQNKGTVGNVFSSKFFKTLGDSTMCFFFSHLIVIDIMNKIVPDYFCGEWLLGLVVATIVALCLHTFIEKPVNKYWLS